MSVSHLLANAPVQPLADAYGVTTDRVWATAAGLLALVAAVVGGLALARSTGRNGTGRGRRGAVVALMAGLVALVNGALVVVTADGGPGTGNGVVGGYVALVIGLIAVILGITAGRATRPERGSFRPRPR